MERTKLRKFDGTAANQTASETLILKISVDVLRVILDHLDPIDRTVLRYPCKQLYWAIRTAADDFPYSKEDKLAKMLMAARLLNSNLCPRIKDSTGTHCPTPDELRTGFACELCQEFWPGEGENTVRCPFHAHLAGGKGHSTLSSSMRGVSSLLYGPRPYWERHPPLTFDECVRIIKKEASRAPPGGYGLFSAGYISSWIDALLQMEITLYTHQDDDSIPNPDPNTPTAHGSRLDSVSSTSLTPNRRSTHVKEIVT